MKEKEFYDQKEVPQEEWERLKQIGYPNYVSETILGRLDLRDKKILDSGAGPNAKLAEFVIEKGGVYVPMDLQPVALQQMRDQLHPKDQFRGVVGDARALPFGDGAFDVVHQRFVLMNIAKESRKKALQELLRVGREKLVLLEYNWEALRSTDNPEVIETFRGAALELFKGFASDPYMGKQFDELIHEVDPSLPYRLEHFIREESVENVPELILNIKGMQQGAKNGLKNKALAVVFQELIDRLEKEPIKFSPPEITAAILTK